MQLAKRYVNAHALVDLCLSAVFAPPLGSSSPASTKIVQEACIVVSTPTVIEKGAPLPLRASQEWRLFEATLLGHLRRPTGSEQHQDVRSP